MLTNAPSAFRDGSYWGPNDEQANEHLDLAHALFTKTLNGKLYLAPISSTAKEVLDLGTGTGVWAIDFADEHPDCSVIGTDLSPIQPNWVSSPRVESMVTGDSYVCLFVIPSLWQ